ncbi:MAG: hypothetical protein LBS05_00990 [Tannerellaceae bacterium]|jgi:hypothetical protein|nr:hypothetical protein [Tannerellaceae bacterium]
MEQTKVAHRFFREGDFPLLEDLLYEAIFQPEGADPLPRNIIKEPEQDYIMLLKQTSIK